MRVPSRAEGGPVNRTRPPCVPAPSPSSMTQSAARMTAGLVLDEDEGVARRRGPSRASRGGAAWSRGCRPTVGSSRT